MNKYDFTNPILDTDSYKFSHFNLYPPGTEVVYSYIESRGGKFDRTLFFGLQIWLKNLRPITQEDIDEAAVFCQGHGEPFNREGWEYILHQYSGRLPLKIRAVPEGLVIPTHNVLVTVENTDPRCFWLTSFIETALLRAVWYPTTVSTVSWHAKQLILAALTKSSEDPQGQIGFRLHDFSARGVSSRETAAIGGAAHLVNFMGTDTVSGVLAANRYYKAGMAGQSIPATEHSVTSAWGRDNETAFYKHVLNQYATPGAMVASVSDTYDLWHVVNNVWGGTLKEQIEQSGATLVVRPDSGNPLVIPTQVITALGERFGHTTNRLGFKLLPNCTRAIQGDGITIDSIPVIFDNLLAAGWSAENLTLGMGGGLSQQVNRDTLQFAQKASAIRINNEWKEIYKDPVTDAGKRSKRGRFILTRERGKWETLPIHQSFDWANVLTTVWENGELKKDWTFDEVRARSNLPAFD
jgi:nicotinamide phosphoribosyltransferase